jgi:hypothetical protein
MSQEPDPLTKRAKIALYVSLAIGTIVMAMLIYILVSDDLPVAPL